MDRAPALALFNFLGGFDCEIFQALRPGQGIDAGMLLVVSRPARVELARADDDSVLRLDATSGSRALPHVRGDHP